MRHEPSDAAVLRHVRRSLQHDSADRHVTGAAPYIDDIREPEGTLHVVPGGSPVAHGRLRGLDLTAVRAAPGVVAVLTAADIPGRNDVSPVAGDDPLFAADVVAFHGQPLFAVVAESRDAARRAARLATVDIATEAPLVSIADAAAAGADIMPAYAFRRGDPEAVLAAAPATVSGRLAIGGQEHFYLEGQAALATFPSEDGDVSRPFLDAASDRGAAQRRPRARHRRRLGRRSRSAAWAAASAARRARRAAGRRWRHWRRGSPAGRRSSGSTATTISP
jgi:xanthine dehydrogenase large subunit